MKIVPQRALAALLDRLSDELAESSEAEILEALEELGQPKRIAAGDLLNEVKLLAAFRHLGQLRAVAAESDQDGDPEEGERPAPGRRPPVQ